MPTREQRAKKLGIPVGDLPDARGRHGKHPRGDRHHRWSRDRMLSEEGYVKLRVGREHPLADVNGYAYEHAIVWASAGLPAPRPDEVHHHKNEDKTDNRIGNLEIKTRVGHGVNHQATALPDHEVLALREDYAAGDHTGILAKRYGIPQQTVWKIVRGMTRRAVGGPIQEQPLRVGKSRAGRLLDGREHNAFPEARHG